METFLTFLNTLNDNYYTKNYNFVSPILKTIQFLIPTSKVLNSIKRNTSLFSRLFPGNNMIRSHKSYTHTRPADHRHNPNTTTKR